MNYKNPTIFIYDNNIGVDLYGADNITVITFHYQGKFEGVSVLPNGWITCGTSSSIFCFGQQSGDISGIMDYNGKIDILSASMFNKYNERYDVNIVKEEGSYFDTSNIIPEKEGSLYEDYPSGDATITKNRYKSVSLVTNNLNARQGQFCYSDGSGYIGKYHMHLNGTIMSGESHTASSEILYTKDRDGNIIYHNKEMEYIYKNNSNPKFNLANTYRRTNKVSDLFKNAIKVANRGKKDLPQMKGKSVRPTIKAVKAVSSLQKKKDSIIDKRIKHQKKEVKGY